MTDEEQRAALERAEAAYRASPAGRIAALFQIPPPEDPPLHPEQGRGEAYERGRVETWWYFAVEVRDEILDIFREMAPHA